MNKSENKNYYNSNCRQFNQKLRIGYVRRFRPEMTERWMNKGELYQVSVTILVSTPDKSDVVR